MLNYEKYMKICFNLAKKGEGKTSPNPLVGAILVDKNGNVMAKGYHKKYGDSHAERNCIENYEKKCKSPDYSNLTMFVNLEPCNHYGKTPPCSDLIIEKNIKKVVVAVKDPVDAHSGGLEKLRANGVEVVENVLSDKAMALNEVFFKNAKENLPFVVIKTATTLDGKIATKTGSSKWVTSDKSREYVQKLRNKYDAILTSSTTIVNDNPSLTARGKGLKNPVRIILDKNLKTDVNSKVYNDDKTKVILFCANKTSTKNYPKNVEKIYSKLDKQGNLDLKFILNTLYEMGIKSVLVEAGGILNGAFLKENLVDKIYHFIAPKLLGDNSAKTFIEGFLISDINKCQEMQITNVTMLNPDILIELSK